MISPSFRASEKVRDLAKYVIVYSVAALFLNYFNVTLEKIPFTDLPLPKSGPIFSVSAALSLIAAYTWLQLVILYRSEYLDYDRLELESIVKSIKEGKFAQGLPEEVRDKVELQAAFGNLQRALRRAHDKLLVVGWVRIANEIVLPSAVLALALYVDAKNMVAFLATLHGFGGIWFLAFVFGYLAALLIAGYLLDLAQASRQAKWIALIFVTVVAIAIAVVIRNYG